MMTMMITMTMTMMTMMTMMMMQILVLLLAAGPTQGKSHPRCEESKSFILSHVLIMATITGIILEQNWH